ncbi:MAG: AI-2E family transporter [Tissierellales bacterium]|jgi:predicted PurR-regulated permease PerM|nr:AI-2E family transporter [Tissierellales bacterium]
MEANVKISYAKLLLIVIVGIIFFNVVNDAEKFRWLMSILTPLLTAFAIAYLLDPMVSFFMRNLKVSRGISIALTTIIVIGVVFFLVMIGLPYLAKSLTDSFNALSSYMGQVDEILTKVETSFNRPEVYQITAKIRVYIDKFAESVGTWVPDIAPLVLNKALNFTLSVFGVVISFFLAIYMLVDKSDLMARVKRFIYAFKKKESADQFMNTLEEANDIFSKFLVGKFIDSLIIGIICFLVLFIFKIPNGALISTIVGITNMIPYFGPFIGAVPSVLITLLIDPIKALWLMIIIFALQQFDGLYLGPKILGDRVGVRPFWILLAVTLGGKVMGVVGMLLGVPFVVLIKSILERKIKSRLEKLEMSDFCEDDLLDKKEKFKAIKKIIVKK